MTPQTKPQADHLWHCKFDRLCCDLPQSAHLGYATLPSLTPLQREVEPPPACSRCERSITTLGGLYRCAQCHAAFDLSCIKKHFNWGVGENPHPEALAVVQDALNVIDLYEAWKRGDVPEMWPAIVPLRESVAAYLAKAQEYVPVAVQEAKGER